AYRLSRREVNAGGCLSLHPWQNVTIEVAYPFGGHGIQGQWPSDRASVREDAPSFRVLLLVGRRLFAGALGESGQPGLLCGPRAHLWAPCCWIGADPQKLQRSIYGFQDQLGSFLPPERFLQAPFNLFVHRPVFGLGRPLDPVQEVSPQPMLDLNDRFS